LRVSAVSYLNTWPLVWGFLNNPKAIDGAERYQFRFDLPAQCADALGAGDVDLGLVPCAELDRLGMGFLPDLGIACDGPVRSILLMSRVPFGKIRTLAADSSSRTSVALTRILLAERYGCRPEITRHAPRLEEMLAEHDAALIIGDPALHIDPADLDCETLDLGAEWVAWSGLPMVFAVWAGREPALTPEVARAFRASYEWGRSHTEQIVARAAAERGFRADVAREYVTRHIVYELGPRHRAGLDLFRTKVRELDCAKAVL
jgi:chorismate dehydratase